MTDIAVFSFAGQDSGYNSSIPASHAEEANLYEEPPDTSAIYEEPPQVGVWGGQRTPEGKQAAEGQPGSSWERGWLWLIFWDESGMGVSSLRVSLVLGTWAEISRKGRNPGARTRSGCACTARGCCWGPFPPPAQRGDVGDTGAGRPSPLLHPGVSDGRPCPHPSRQPLCHSDSSSSSSSSFARPKPAEPTKPSSFWWPPSDSPVSNSGVVFPLEMGRPFGFLSSIRLSCPSRPPPQNHKHFERISFSHSQIYLEVPAWFKRSRRWG